MILTKTFFENPDFLGYARLLGELHRLIQEGRDESPEGEALRDQMDAPGERLSQAEVVAIKAIAADFYSLMEPSGELAPATTPDDDQIREIIAARESGRFQEALSLVRQSEAVLPPARLAWLRGTIWRIAREPALAQMFFARAAELEPDAFFTK